MYYKENGLQVASKKFDELEEIYSLEFIDSDEKLFVVGKHKDSKKVKNIIWDIYRTGKAKADLDCTYPSLSSNFFNVRLNQCHCCRKKCCNTPYPSYNL